jgi:branched-chain amino acid transport system substrate-binding protein
LNLNEKGEQLMKKLLVLLIATVAATTLAVGAFAGDTRGVTDDTINFGTHTDLSGPLASWGVAATNGLKMRFKEANDAGGIHGRKIKLFVEDTGYQVPLAVKATNKLINRDKIFAMIGSLGTSQNNASMALQFKAGVPNLFPLSGAQAMGLPFQKLKFGYFANYKNQMIAGVKYFAKNAGVKTVCLQAVSSDAGQEMEDGFNLATKKLGIEVKYVGHHKTTETEFAGTATKIVNSGCDMLVSATSVKDTIILHATLKKLGWGDKPVVTNMVSYMPLVAKAAGGAMNGLYSVVSILDADFINGNAASKKFGTDYKAAYSADPTNQAQSGYIFADLTVKALEKAGKNLTVDSLVSAIESISNYEDPFGTSSASYNSKSHVGANRLSLTQVKNLKWETVKQSIPFDL